MDKPDAPFRRLRQHVVRKTIEIIRDRVHRIDHDSLSRTRMRALSLERDRRSARAPRLVADLAELFAVNCVRELRSETLYVKLLDTRADLFIGRESDRECSVFDLRVLTQDIDHRHDLGTA